MLSSLLPKLKAAVLPALGAAVFALGIARALFNTFPLLFGEHSLWIAIALFAPLAWVTSRRPQIALPLLLPAATLFTNAAPLRDWAIMAGGASAAAAMWLKHRPQWQSVAYPASIAIYALAIYLGTLAPTVGEADTFEFQVNVVRLGVSHGSGYPLYILLAKLFSLLPVGGTTAFRINLSAAAFGAVAALSAYAVMRALQTSRAAAWVGAMSLAIAYGLWSRAIEAEVYTLHVALIGLLLWQAIRLYQRSTPQRERWLAFTFGLSLTNHLTTVLLLPALLAAALFGRRQHPHPLRAGYIFQLILLFLLGLSLYLYLPLRWYAVNNGEVMSWDLFMHFITGQEAQGALRLNAWYADPGRYIIVGRKALEQFGWVGVALAGVGLVALVRRALIPAILTLLAFAAYAYFGLSFYVPDPDYSSFLLPAHLVQAIWIGVGLTAISQFFAERPSWRTWQAASLVAAVLLPASLLWSNWSRIDQSRDWREYHLGQYILSHPLAQNAAILADSELIAPLYYLQVAENIRPDLDIIVLPNEEAYRAELDYRIANNQPVYLGRYLPHLADAYYLRSVGPVVQVGHLPGSLPADSTPLDQTFGGEIKLHGYKLDAATATSDTSLRLTLYWQAVQPPSANYRVALRLVDLDGQIALAAPHSVPVSHMYPAGAWAPDDVVADYHEFMLTPSLTPGVYQLQVGLFVPFTIEGLATPSGDHWQTIQIVTIEPPRQSPVVPNPLRYKFDNDIWLMGYDAPATAVPGSPINLSLYWLLPVGLPEPLVVSLCTGQPVCNDIRLSPASLPQGQIVQTQTSFMAPLTPGKLTLRLGADGQTIRCGWLAPARPACSLPDIAIEGSPLSAEMINFDNQIVLDRLELETPSATPGNVVIVTARWRALRPMNDDYTVFVHLLGPDGLVHGQVDSWPVQGTRPTTQWQVNQPIADRFEIRVPDDAPDGEYTIEVGWYLLATLDRLPVVDSNNVEIDDKFLTVGLTIQR